MLKFHKRPLAQDAVLTSDSRHAFVFIFAADTGDLMQ